MRRRPPVGPRCAVLLALTAALVMSGCATDAIHQAAPRQSAAHRSSPAVLQPVAGRAVASSSAPATPSISAAPSVPATPCVRNRHPQLVYVDVHAQHVWMCAAHRAVFDSPVTTGAAGLPYDATPTGTFHIQERDRNQTLTLVSGQAYTVKYWIPFDAPLFGFHDAPWQTMPFGSQGYRTHGSHGCVHMPLRTMRFLYRWGHVGATVRITV